jgi:DNA-binding transcriptional ArsR family regulator
MAETNMDTTEAREPTRTELLDWVEKLAFRLSEVGSLPLIAARILGWLMVCEPAEQSADEIAEAIGASRASLSTNLRLLTAIQMVGAVSRPGKRIRYYRIEEDAWEAAIRVKIAALASFRHMAEDGMTLIGADGERTRRLRLTRDAFEWLQRTFEDAPPLSKSQNEDS